MNCRIQWSSSTTSEPAGAINRSSDALPVVDKAGSLQLIFDTAFFTASTNSLDSVRKSLLEGYQCNS